ncbi:MAG: lipopolysaccharide transport periplasmic protein LptA [Gammaproteobacteria bacterium]|nr:lipopolysaccharide transport periplasmic protein LptA [Gammaproteobacteria bacterium]
MKVNRHSLVLLVGLLVSTHAAALSTDRDQPAEIEADDIEFDFKKGVRTYTDNVLIVQGTLRLKADKLVAIYKDSELDNATAWGSLARFKQRPDGKQDDVEGWAQKIIVNQQQNTLTLIGKAALKQGRDTARGETIVYNMATDTLRVSGGAKLGATGKDGQSVPKRSIEDPFKDDPQGPPPVATVKPKAKPVVAESGDTAEVTAEEVADEQPVQPEPVPAGRSRLIIQPK